MVLQFDDVTHATEWDRDRLRGFFDRFAPIRNQYPAVG
jgi:hypothetical protein